jgi:hypothetical protein
MAATLGVAMLGCGASVVVDVDEGGGGGGGEDATIAADASATSTSSAAAGGAGGTLELGPIVITKKCVIAGETEADYQAYVDCCDAVQWNANAGCQAWGPPMPPSMDWRGAEVA